MARAHHKEWYGNERVQDILRGPFFGFKLTPARVVEVNYEIGIRWAQFSMPYFREYVVCAGPAVGEALTAILTEGEAAAPCYQGETLADCLANIFRGEGLEMSPGYADHIKPPAPIKPPPFEGRKEGQDG